MSDAPRLRFAPSPTGYLHIGGARTALFNWLWARHTGGKFILRIEDTDRERSTEEAVKAILDGMRWLGLDWDEGPEVGGPHGPYFQTQRQEIYRAHLDQLVKAGRAYACTCTKEELDVLRAEAAKEKRQFIYPGTCRERPFDPAKKHVWRFRIPPRIEQVEFVDLVKGTITRPGYSLQDEVIVRGDGIPLYNFGAVVDDVTMKITLVARGDDHVNNTAIQVLLYQAFGYPVPTFAHLPMILGADKTRLSKRHGATSVTQYRDLGYLPHAVVNYLVRIGWGHGDQEVFSLDELVKLFDLKDVGATAGVFNPEKMTWLNHHWMKAMPVPELCRRALPYFAAAGIPVSAGPKLELLVKAYQERAKTFVELVEQSRYCFLPAKLDEKAKAKFLTAEAKPLLQAVREGIAGIESPGHEALEKLFHQLAESRGLGLGKVAQPVRVALTGGTASPGIYDVVMILGKAETLSRLDAAVAGIA